MLSRCAKIPGAPDTLAGLGAFAKLLAALGALRVLHDGNRDHFCRSPGAQLFFDLDAFLVADQIDGFLDKIADHALDIAAIVTDLGVLGGLDLNEWRAR